MEGPATLELLSEKTLHQPVDPRLVAYNPSMDLLALGCTDQQVLIYRLNGQRVYGSSPKSGAIQADSFAWKPNGQLFAIAWNDGSVRILGPETNKTIHQFSTVDETSGVTCIGWVCNHTRKNLELQESKNALQPLDEFSFDFNILSKGLITLDLPRDLAHYEIERSMPRLSLLPAGSSTEDAFTSRDFLDMLFRPYDPSIDYSLDVMIVGTKEGNIHLSIYDSFLVGSFNSPLVIQGIPSYLSLHASHESYSTHALLMKSSASEDKRYFVPMDLRFISTSGDYLFILSSRSTALNHLLRYIHQAQILLVAEWKETQELPAKFIRNINETLEKTSSRDIIQALYHSVATGHTFPEVRDWLVDELTERGHKRWDKVVTSGLENIKRIVHENMLPALDRCSVILSRLAGIAKFQGSDETIGLSSHQISLIVDTVACLNLVCSKILAQAVEELDLFSSFSTWLRNEIDRLVSDPSLSSTNDEAAEKEGSIDHTKVLLYLQTAMTASPLAVYLGPLTFEDEINKYVYDDHGVSMFKLLDSQLQKQEQGLPYLEHLPRTSFLSRVLTRQATTVFDQIAEAERRNVLFGKAEELGDIEAALDMRISPIDPSSFDAHIAVMPKGQPGQVQVIRITLSIENGMSTVRSVELSTVKLGDGRVKDMKFADGYTLLVLWESNGSTSLLRVPYRRTNRYNTNEYIIPYSPRTQDGPPNPIVFDNNELLKRFSGLPVNSEGSFVPEKMHIRWQGGEKGNDETRRIVIFGQDQTQYKVFRLARSHGNITTADEDISMS